LTDPKAQRTEGTKVDEGVKAKEPEKTLRRGGNDGQ